MHPDQSKLYCVWAHRGMALHNSGGALLCCHSRTFLQDHKQQQIFWHSHSVSAALSSPTRGEIQQALHQGIQHPNCNACWDEENVGKKSRRLSHLDLATEVAADSAQHDDDTVLYLDLKLGNICNLACRTCNPWVSSSWYHDWYNTIPQERQEFPIYRDYVNNKHRNSRLSYSDDNTEFWQELQDRFQHVRYVDIYGAEPMMIEKLFDILETNVSLGLSQSQTLHFNTNATIWDQRKINILDQYKRVYFDLSLDGIDKHYDYIRYGRTWDQVLPVVDNYLAFAAQSQRHCFNIVLTVSVFNIWYLDQLWDFWYAYTGEKNGQPLTMHFNIAHLPDHINIKCLPADVKSTIQRKLMTYTNREYQQHVSGVINYLMTELDHADQQRHWQEFERVTLELDRLRQQDFSDTFPEFFSLLQPYFKSV